MMDIEGIRQEEMTSTRSADVVLCLDIQGEIVTREVSRLFLSSSLIRRGEQREDARETIEREMPTIRTSFLSVHKEI